MNRQAKIGLCIFFLCAGIGFGGSVWRTDDIYTRTSDYNMASQPSWVEGKTLRLEKDNSEKWNWQYIAKKDDDGSYEPYKFFKIEQMCPTAKQDAMLKVDGKIVYSTNEKLTKISNDFTIMDASKNKVYRVKSGEEFDENVNGQNLGVSLAVYDSGNDVKAYVLGNGFNRDNFKILKHTGEDLIDVSRNIIRGGVWTYDINYIGSVMLNETQIGVLDPYQTSLILVHYAFIEDPYNYDVCNITFLPFMITSTVSLVLSFGLFISLCVDFCKGDNQYEDTDSKSN